MKVEIFKPVIFRGFLVEGYEVSNKGTVRSLPRQIKYTGLNQTGVPFEVVKDQPGKVRKPRLDKGGYLIVNIAINGRTKTVKVHRLVAEAFIPNPYNLKTVNHLDECKTNNSVENLEWCSTADNNRYGSRAEKYKAIVVFEDGKKILEFESLNSASRALDIAKSSIIKMINGSTVNFKDISKREKFKNYKIYYADNKNISAQG